MIPYLGEFYYTKGRDLAILTASIILGLICVLLPFLASLVFNINLSFEIPFTDLTYKPWRLFMFISGIPNLITGVAIFFLPESPKFLQSQRSDGNALFVIKDVGSNARSISAEYLRNQTPSLFSRKYLKLTVIICGIHFFAFAIGGMGSWYPEIVNSLTFYINENETRSANICEIFGDRLRPETNKAVCAEKFELSTYSFVIFSEVLFVLVMLIISVAVRWISKPILLSKQFFL